jgi:rSAM/selenodomain-associated transferase 2
MISVVIPTRNEAVNIARLIAALAAESEPHECLVVDAQSTDGTPAIAVQAGARVISSAPGRGHQLSQGIAASRGATIWMLHADCRIAPGALAAIGRALDADPQLVGGNFRLHFDGGDRFSRWLDGFYAWLRTNGFYYGDSGIFVRREIYGRVGGMPAHALMEDYAFVRRLEAAGPTVCIAEPALVTSSRRFHGRKPAGIVGGWLMIHALYHLGVAPARLAWIYDRVLR